jgi:hypothetical protein
MRYPFKIILPIILLLSLVISCNFPANPVSENSRATINGVDTTQDVKTSSTSSLEMPPAVKTDELKPINGTAIAAVSITPLQLTPLGGKATITSTEDTNCRKGPGTMYEIVGKLMVGQTSDVVAKYQSGKFWLIKNPANPTQECWVWDETTKVTGDIASLPEATPPATPEITLSLTIYAIISPINYNGACPVTVDLTGNYTINTPAIISYQWYLGDLLVSSGAATAGSSGTFTSIDQITITNTTTNPIRLKASAPPKTVTTYPIGFSIICN